MEWALHTRHVLFNAYILFIADANTISEITNNKQTGFNQYLSNLEKNYNIKAKIISEDIYIQKFNSAFKFSKDTDFGIYGDNMLFIYNSENEDYGWYIRNQDQVKQYTSFFETIFFESSII